MSNVHFVTDYLRQATSVARARKLCEKSLISWHQQHFQWSMMFKARTKFY